ncbi:hypothetical protein CONPUDRAFT_152792 [Coniophora puteana RWD-64-598 SS2]|uniref:Uncharacterized protein n=1 Tax=Coniophora puteana (strain RWD-64-598) TaxID=741705 RepID=A0A5M3MRW2_CONPW|nr:uncharacterized protein CONPUDRAFT_152792 [Coniophora puteana RWD-64-598 SS2]EIW81892.1 hypothetical protein CONPUDRAFT_152792 [Coniophora puteana RWD-64-598 SS2]
MLYNALQYMLPVAPVARHSREYMYRVHNTQVLPRSTSDDIIALLSTDFTSGLVSGDLVSDITSACWKVMDLGVDDLAVLHAVMHQDNVADITLAWESDPVHASVDSNAGHNVHFWVSAHDVDRTAKLAEFLCWFWCVHCGAEAALQCCIRRIGYVFVDGGVSGVLLCDSSIDLRRVDFLDGFPQRTMVCVAERMFCAVSSCADISVQTTEDQALHCIETFRNAELKAEGMIA